MVVAEKMQARLNSIKDNFFIIIFMVNNKQYCLSAQRKKEFRLYQKQS